MQPLSDQGNNFVMVEKANSGILALVCLATGREIGTGVRYSRDDLARVARAKLLLHCPFCGQTHLFHFSDARLQPGDGRERTNGHANHH
jgi:hypothetical protein